MKKNIRWYAFYAVASAATVIGAALLVLGMIALGAAAFTMAPWALYNFVVAPMFGWPACAFWKVFLLCWCASCASRILLSGTRK